MNNFVHQLMRRVRRLMSHPLRGGYRGSRQRIVRPNVRFPRTYTRRARGMTLYSVSSWAVVTLALLFVFTMWRGGTPERPAPAIAVWNAHASSLHELSLEEYVRGVVAAEMPAGFHPEALKAQAVAARTYALRRIERDERLAGQGDAHVSSDFRVHQAWLDEEQFLAARPPELGTQQWEAIGVAVDATRGIVLTYGGELIEALYHSTSGGHTEDSARYFQAVVPYLKAAPDPYGDHSPVHTSRTVLSAATVLNRLGVGSVPTVAAGEGQAPTLVLEVRTRTAAGRVAELTVAGRTFTGRQVREALGLRSSWFDVELDGDKIIFNVRGSGHGVGMAQYGADGMGRAGHSFETILAYYYPGTVLERRY